MEPIEFNHTLYGVGNNPFVLEMLAHQQAHETHPVEAQGAVNTPAPTAQGITPLTADQQALAVTLSRILDKARTYFRMSQLGEAEKEYKRFLQYQNYFGFYNLELRSQYYPALFELSWLSNILGHQAEAERLLNEELVKHLNLILKEKKPDLQVVQQYIHHLQDEAHLPNQYNLRVPLDAIGLERLVKQLVAHGEREYALQVLGHLEVRHLLDVFQTEQMAQNLRRQLGGPPVQGERSKWLLPLAYAHYGLPFAPFFPIIKEEADKIRSKKPPEHLEIEETDRVEPIFALNKDPDEEKEREQQREKLARYEKLRGNCAPPVPENRPLS